MLIRIIQCAVIFGIVIALCEQFDITGILVVHLDDAMYDGYGSIGNSVDDNFTRPIRAVVMREKEEVASR